MFPMYHDMLARYSDSRMFNTTATTDTNDYVEVASGSNAINLEHGNYKNFGMSKHHASR